MVSIIIPTTNKEASMAQECKQSVLDSNYKNVQIHVINAGKERSEQRNIGIESSSGEYILYLDSDQKVSPELIQECVDLMRFGFNSIYIPEVITTPGWFAKLRQYERDFYTGTAVDCVRFIRRDCCPKFSTDLNGPEDSYHDRQVLGLRTVSKNVLYHHDRIGFWDYFKKKAYYAKSMKKYKQLVPRDKVLNWKYRCFGIFVEDGKWKKIIRHPIMFAGVMMIVLIRAIIYLRAK